MFDQSVFGEKLKNYRKELDLTQEELGEKIGISGQAVSKSATRNYRKLK